MLACVEFPSLCLSQSLFLSRHALFIFFHETVLLFLQSLKSGISIVSFFSELPFSELSWSIIQNNKQLACIMLNKASFHSVGNRIESILQRISIQLRIYIFEVHNFGATIDDLIEDAAHDIQSLELLLFFLLHLNINEAHFFESLFLFSYLRHSFRLTRDR